MRLAITSPHKDSYSETFIRAGVERLAGEKEVFYGGMIPTHRRGSGRFYPPKNKFRAFVGKLQLRLGGQPPAKQKGQAYLKELQRCGIDVALVHYADAAMEMMDFLQEGGISLVVHCHGHDVHRESTVAPYRDRFSRLGEIASTVIAVSEKMEAALIALGVPTHKIVRRPCSVDVEKFSLTDPSNNPPVFVFVGRFAEKKAPYLTLLAFKQVHAQLPEARLIMGGDGVLFGPCLELAHQFGIADAVDFTGVMTHEEVAARMRQARAFVQHSIVPQHGDAAGDSEGTPVAVLEASASGLPVVSTRHAGICQAVVEGETGYLVEERDVSGMAAKMLRLAQDPLLAKQLGQAGRQHMEKHYSLEQYIETLDACVAKAVNEKKAEKEGIS